MEIIEHIEQGSDEWHWYRAGRPTASEFKKLITSTGAKSEQRKDYAIQLAAEKYAGKPLDRWEGNQYTEAGHDREPLAREYYEFTTGNEVKQVAFVISGDSDRGRDYGCSPDGLIGDVGCQEIKCLSAKEHMKAIMYCQKHGKIPTAYVQQTQGEMFICEREWCDVVFYHPDLPSHIQRCYPIDSVVEGLKVALDDCFNLRDLILSDLKWI